MRSPDTQLSTSASGMVDGAVLLRSHGDDELFELSSAAAQLSVTLRGDDVRDGPMEVPLERINLQRVTMLLEQTAALLNIVPEYQRPTLIANGLPTGSAPVNNIVLHAESVLDELGVATLGDAARLLRDLRWFDATLTVSMLAARVANHLRGNTADWLRTVLGAHDDLSDAEKRDALNEPLFAPPDPAVVPPSDAAAPQPLATSILLQMDDGIPDEGNTMTCLASCDARTLHELKAVSADWRRRAREVLGAAGSAWRRRPIWSVTEEGMSLVARLANANWEERREALKAMGQTLDGRFELPAHAAATLQMLADPNSKVRAAAGRTLDQLQPEVLVVHAPALIAMLASPEPYVHNEAAGKLRKLSRRKPRALDAHAAVLFAMLDAALATAAGDVAVTALTLLSLAALEAHSATLIGMFQDSSSVVSDAVYGLSERMAEQADAGPEPPSAAVIAMTEAHNAARIQALVVDLEDPVAEVRATAVVSLTLLSQATLEAHSATLIGMFQDPSRVVRNAVYGLTERMAEQAEAGPEPPSAAVIAMTEAHIAALIVDLEHGDWNVRYEAVRRLRRWLPEALEVHVVALVELAEEDPDWGVRWATIKTLGRLPTSTLVAHTAAIVRIASDDVREEVRNDAGGLLAQIHAHFGE